MDRRGDLLSGAGIRRVAEKETPIPKAMAEIKRSVAKEERSELRYILQEEIQVDIFRGNSLFILKSYARTC
jgi:hypothetical protein